MDIYEQYPSLLNADFIASFDFGTCFTVQNPDGAVSEFDLAVAMIRFEGSLTHCSAVLLRSRRVLAGFLARNYMLQDLVQDLENSFLDRVEYAYKTNALSRDGEAAQRFVLSTRGRDRGYVTRVENRTTLQIGPVQTLSDDELAAIVSSTGTPETEKSALVSERVGDRVRVSAGPTPLAADRTS